jgi:hypothetical protein
MWHKWQNELSSLFYVLLIILVISVLRFFEAFIWLDEWAYDNFEYWIPHQEVEQHVLLIEMPLESREQGNETWLTLLESLKPAKQIVFTFLPKKVSSDFYCQAKEYGNVFFARLMQPEHGPNTPKPSSWTPWLQSNSALSASWRPWIEPLPKMPARCEIDFGLVDMPPHIHGIHRRQYTAFTFEDEVYPALEVLAAEHFLGMPLMLRKENYRIYFGNEQLDKLPRIKLNHIGQSINSELIAKHSVMIGFATSHSEPGLHTPLSLNYDNMISMPQFQALALNTLLNDQQIITLRSSLEWLLLLFLIALTGFLYHFFNTQQALSFTLFMSCFYLFVAWLLYRYVGLWLPILEIIFAQWLLYWFDFKYKWFKSDLKLHEKLVARSRILQKQHNAQFLATDQYWSQVVAMLHDILHLNRVIILEYLPYSNSSFLREIKALHCSIEDIEERNGAHKPYTVAIQKNGALLLTQPLLKAIGVHEQQYLVPLIFSNDTLGFLLLSFQETKYQNKNQFENTLKDLSFQLAESIYHRQQGVQQNNQNSLHDYFQIEQSEAIYQSFNYSITSIEHELSGLHNIIDGLETPTIIYDIFGVSASLNKSMSALSQTFKLSADQNTLLELMMRLCQKDMDTAQQYFRHLVLEDNAIVQQVTLTAGIKRVFILYLQLFYYQEEGEHIKKGILCQLVDITQVKLHNTLKEQVAERLIFQFRNDMQSIMTASKLLSSEQSSLEEKRMIAGILQGKVNSHLKILNEVETQLNIELDANKTLFIENYPIDAKEAILDAIEKVYAIAREHQVSFHHDLPALVSLVFAAPNELSLVIASILSVLVHEAAPNTHITINMEERNNMITYVFKNKGAGMENERLQQYLFFDEVEIPEQFNSLRRAIKLITHWKGTLAGSSKIDEGLSFTLCLRSFI